MADVETSIRSTLPSSSTISPPSPPQQSGTSLATTNNTTALLSQAQTEDSVSAPKKTKTIVRRKRRPARPQVDPSSIKFEPPPQTGTIFNIWYNKWSGGDREDKYLSKTAAPGRCNVATDSGYTRADKVVGSYFCLFFAKGLCPRGHECDYLHRLPGLHDLFNPNVDCFGRDKHSDYRDDMGGVGSFMRQNRTLYVGRIHVTDDIEEVVARHFAEWGQIDRIRVLTSRGVAFVTYTNEANSQFAKEAMAHQALDHNEVLNVRWATVDPNPMAQKREARKIEEQAAEAVRRALPEEFVRELEGRDPEAQKRRRIEGNFGLEGYIVPDEIWYTKSRGAIEGVQESGETPALKHEERSLIEDSPRTGPPETISNAGGQADDRGGGILSSSALAALERNKGALVTAVTPPPAPTGPLVAYGSEDESD
jgi:hypothetical protein